VKYYQGFRSPNVAEREEKGYSTAWLHHKGRNKHHYEYWMDYSVHNIEAGQVAAKMPLNYLVEMFFDRVAAAKIYGGKNYQDSNALEYYLKGADSRLLNPQNKRQLEYLLKMFAKQGEDYTIRQVRKLLRRKKLLQRQKLL
jgi:hypothetical protein